MSYSATQDTRIRLVLTAAAVMVLAGLVYVNALANPFVYDDYATVLTNHSIDRPGDLKAIVLGAPARPLVNFSYAIDRAIWGTNPFGFRLANVLLHMVNVALLFAFVRRAAADHVVGKGSLWTISPHATATAAAIIFALHPMMTEAVGYISGRAELFAALFVLLTLLAGRRWMGGGGRGYWALTVVCWLAAVLSKETAVMLPVVLLAYDWWLLDGNPAARRHRLLRLYLPLFALTVIVALARLYVMVQLEYPGEIGWRWRLVPIQLGAMGRYLELLIVPHDQAIYHGLPSGGGLLDVRVLAIPVLLAVSLLASQRHREWRLAAFGLATFGLFLLPASILYVLNIGEVMAEHRVYVASIGIILALGAFVGWLVGQLHLVGTGARRVAWAALALVALQLAALTVARNRIWQNPETLWREALDRAPNDWMPNAQLAETLRQSDRCNEAIPYYQRALGAHPDSAYLTLIYSRLGACELRLNRLGEAARTFSTLTLVAPQSAEGPLGLALVSIARNDGGDPRPQLRAAMQRDPNNIGARQLLASLEEPEHPAEALRLCQEIKQMAPATPGVDECLSRSASRVRNQQQ